ncbi:T9SS type B sorting domain-containing protein [Winogradskyella sp.]|uniref:T9SS type B sorting domain-containing protein n=1 Tax=Winogradskyella sp. TaxID=1883156 RepID=UPI0025CEC590|nr:choice-of-anchor L domain-containing protein [Winogradskyella sp.]MCT4629028.1 T9SS type B sorting domain-containing protein [Winogradskyella sp.]
MKHFLLFFVVLITISSYSQNITVDSQTYTPQQLIEDILIDSDCITNISVTNVVGGNFGSTEQSYGFFDATGTSFPFQNGIVMSTGRLANVPGPNNNLSDDDAPNWLGDTDLEFALNESNTFNATILEFDFTSIASQVSFRYLFASEEYQENNPNSCEFSDLFGFLIRPTAGQNPYENIALVPDTNIPVKATTVTPGVSGSCPPQNETYFGSYNGTNSPINFNGQTAVLTATANVVPNQSYHVKLVIADEQNYRYDSAVFLEAGSFQLSTDLGPNRLLATGNALCEGETLELNANQAGSPSFDWYRDGVLVQSSPSNCVNCGIYEVTQPGTYTVEVGLNNTCISYGEVIIEYAPIPISQNSILVECDLNLDGLTTYNLFDAENDLINNDDTLTVSNFYLTELDAISDNNLITNAANFENTSPYQTVYARVINTNNCFSIAELELQTSNNVVTIPDLGACDGDDIDGFATFTLNDIKASIINQIPTGAEVTYYETEADAFNDSNALPNNYINTTINSQTIYVKIENNNQCFSISTVNLNVLYTPILEEDESIIYCLNTFPETLTIFGGVLNDLPNNYYYEWYFNGSLTNINTSFNNINETGNYTVIVTDPNGCSSSRTITINPSETATIESITIEGISPINTISVNVSGQGFYDYAIDNSDYEESNIFTNVSEGFHTIYIRDRNGCGIIEETISVLGIPKFFTPNDDTKNDLWQVIGTNAQFNQIESIQIFNRYGKHLTTLKHNESGWDGTFNGINLPGDDYWYIIKLLDGKTYKGHFALKR